MNIGASPSGKATDSDSVIRVFESLRPSHFWAVFSDFQLKTARFLTFDITPFSRLGDNWGKIGGRARSFQNSLVALFCRAR